MTARTMLLMGGCILVSSLTGTKAASATSEWAEPPERDHRTLHVEPDRQDEPSSSGLGARSESAVRVSVGSVARADSDGAQAGLFAAFDFGKGPAGFRASAAWVRVGYDDPLAQYTGELTLALGDFARFVPSIGAGGGLARTYRVDETGAHTGGGSNLGVGVLRAAVDYRLPFTDTDARAGISAMGVMPAIRASDAPDLPPWLMLAATVSIGF